MSRQADYGQALEYARRLLQLSPWNEEVHRQRMLFLARTGDYNGAIAQYEQCQKDLEVELGEPSPFLLNSELVTTLSWQRGCWNNKCQSNCLVHKLACSFA